MKNPYLVVVIVRKQFGKIKNVHVGICNVPIVDELNEGRRRAWWWLN